MRPTLSLWTAPASLGRPARDTCMFTHTVPCVQDMISMQRLHLHDCAMKHNATCWMCRSCRSSSTGKALHALPPYLCRSLHVASHNSAPLLRQHFALRLMGHTTAEMFVVIMPSASLLAVACTGAVPSASPALFSRMSTCHGQVCVNAVAPEPLNTFAVNTSLFHQMQGRRFGDLSGLREIASNSAMLAMHTLHGILSYG